MRNKRGVTETWKGSSFPTLLRLAQYSMDEGEAGEVISTSATSVSSSVMEHHRDAATWGYGTLPQVEKVGDGPDPINSEYIEIRERNQAKRQDHSTT